MEAANSVIVGICHESPQMPWTAQIF